MAKKTTYQINVSYQDNTLTTNDPNDKYFTVNSQGTAEIDRIVREMMDVNPGLEQENIGMVLELFNRIIIRDGAGTLQPHHHQAAPPRPSHQHRPVYHRVSLQGRNLQRQMGSGKELAANQHHTHERVA